MTTRDVEKWYRSTLSTVHWRATESELKMVAKWDWAASMYQPMISSKSFAKYRSSAINNSCAEFWDVFWEGDFEKNGKRRFEEYYAHVRSLVPPENLLEFNIAEGWDPLCNFLGTIGKYPLHPHMQHSRAGRKMS